MNKFFDSLFKFFIPKKYYSDQETLRQSKISISFYLFNFISFLIFSFNGIFIEVYELFYATLATGIVCLILAFLYRQGIAHNICALLFSINGTIYISYMVYAAGGFNSTSVFSFILIPVYNLLLTNKLKSGIFWFVVVVTIYFIFVYIQIDSNNIVPLINSKDSKVFFIITVVGFFINIFVLVLIFEYEKNRAITNLIQTNLDLKVTQAQLIQQEKLASLGELTAGIAHEIQNPLNFVNNFSEVSVELLEELKAERQRSEGNRDFALEDELLSDLSQNQEKINYHGKRASDIVKSMLEHSRKSSGEKELININTLCDEYLRLAYHGLRAKDKTFNAAFETQFDFELPKINVLSQDLGRVLLNLINNAFYAVNQKSKLGLVGYDPKVEIRTKEAEDKIEIKIIDNGGGIPSTIKDKIFQPFFTTKPTGQGTGLGLSLAYDIITIGHGGTLEVESREGEGTTFIIQIPKKV
jgi:signal transduction histidine kinase